MRENVNVYGNIYVLMFTNIYVFISMYKCLNKKGNVVFLTLFMWRKSEMIMVAIVL